MGRWINGEIHVEVHELIIESIVDMDGWMGWINVIDGWIDRQMDGQIVRLMDGRTDRWMDRHTRTDGWLDGCTLYMYG